MKSDKSTTNDKPMIQPIKSSRKRYKVVLSWPTMLIGCFFIFFTINRLLEFTVSEGRAPLSHVFLGGFLAAVFIVISIDFYKDWHLSFGVGGSFFSVVLLTTAWTLHRTPESLAGAEELYWLCGGSWLCVAIVSIIIHVRNR